MYTMFDYSQEHVSVGELTRAIRALLEEGIGDVVVVGEISNYKHHSSGHRYFTLKDSEASIAAVMWRTRNLSFVPDDGMKVMAIGRLTVYPVQGKYQIDVVSLKPYGLGELYAALERLKKKLFELGWFDLEHKKSIPALPKTIGIVTSATGAALRDMLTTIRRRNPTVRVVVRPAIVQGEGSAEDIARAIAEFNRVGADVVIVGRGGGSIEDLWSFNTEVVARAIFESEIPIISAVGHETDTTIADYVADRRAATPTAAAELATPITAEDLIAGIDRLHMRIYDSVANRIHKLYDTALAFESGSAANRIRERVQALRTRTDHAVQRSATIMRYRIVSAKSKMLDVVDRMPRLIEYDIHSKSQRVDELLDRSQRNVAAHILNTQRNVEHLTILLDSLHPLAPLRRGYAALEKDGRVIGPDDTLSPGDAVTIVRHGKRNEATVTTAEQV